MAIPKRISYSGGCKLVIFLMILLPVYLFAGILSVSAVFPYFPLPLWLSVVDIAVDLQRLI